MRRHKRKPHIYTFVLKKGMPKIALCTLISVALGLITAYPVSQGESDEYEKFLKACSSDVLKGEREAIPLHTIGADTILRQAWPVFAPSEHTVSVFNQKGADTENVTESEIEITPVTSKNGPYEKSIVSHNLNLSNATDYEIDAQLLADTPMVYDAKKAEPTVLVMHTHGCETYTGETGHGLGDAGSYRSTDTEKNVVRLGAILADELKKKGIGAIHDKTLCDYPSYNLSYKKAMGLNDWYLNRYPSISFIFDIHRDAIAESDGTPVKLTAEIDGKKSAQAMIVCGTDKLGLSHPYWKDNLILALKIQRVMEENYPSLMRPLNIREERFNMHQTRGSLIFEIGTHGNTMEEAERCIRYLAEGIGKLLSD